MASTLGAIANVASDRIDLAAEIAANLDRRRLKHLEPPAADDQFGAKLDEAASHRGAEPGAAAGDQYPLSRQQAIFKHRFKPFQRQPILILKERALRIRL